MASKRSIRDTLDFRRFRSKLLKSANTKMQTNVFGDLTRYIGYLSDRIDRLEGRIEELEYAQNKNSHDVIEGDNGDCDSSLLDDGVREGVQADRVSDLGDEGDLSENKEPTG